MRRAFAVILASSLTGCAGQLKDVGREPAMSPIGSGLAPHDVESVSAVFPESRGITTGSLWDPNRSNFFRDPRASRIGDVVTINISINDSASFGNTTDRSMNSKITNAYDFAASMLAPIISGKGNADASSESSATGKGSIDRSEKIQLSVAGVVTAVMPNGNLLVHGSQEVRVNYELRVLEVAGVVRPGDIGKDNTISYDKIAEARISYGGHGRLSEVQQPGVGQQIYDVIRPY